MKLNDRFHFGKFKGLRLIDVYQGTPNIDRFLIKQYVEYMLNSDDRWIYDTFDKIPYFGLIDYFVVTESEIEVFGMLSEPWNSDSNTRITLGNIEDVLQGYLSIGNMLMGRIIGGFHSLEEFNRDSETRKPIGASPSYLAWCINEVDNFFIDPSDLKLMEKLKITYFKGINVIYRGDDIFEYSPLTETANYSFTPKVIKRNASKFERVKPDTDYDRIQIAKKSKWSPEKLKSANWDYDINDQAHDSIDNSWIDVFGPGEEAETAYWNTD